jgi:hypothetical protein
MKKQFMRRQSKMKNGLLDLCKYINKKDIIMVEIGCYVGESTMIFASQKNIKKIWAIDPWENNYDENDGASEKRPMCIVEKMFDENTMGIDKIFKNKMKSENAVNLFLDKSLDLVYIDGCHMYDAVKQDISLWLSKVKDDGYISGHDYCRDDVKRAVQEGLGEPDKIFKDSSWIIKKS